MDGVEGLPLQDEATLFQVSSTTDTNNNYINKLPHEPEEGDPMSLLSQTIAQVSIPA